MYAAMRTLSVLALVSLCACASDDIHDNTGESQSASATPPSSDKASPSEHEVINGGLIDAFEAHIDVPTRHGPQDTLYEDEGPTPSDITEDLIDLQETSESGPDTVAEPSTGDFPCPVQAPCSAVSAYLNVKGLDIWGQQVPGMSLSISHATLPWEHEVEGASTMIALCGALSLELSASAPLHATVSLTLEYDGAGAHASISLHNASGDGSRVLALQEHEGSSDVAPVYTLWLGLTHHYFAVSGPPARRGNLITLLRDGEEAWETLFVDLQLSDTLVTAATWWWTSELELSRDPLMHPYLSPQERWQYTALGALEDLGLQGVESKVLINQFYSQDGLLSWITSDDALQDAALSPFNGIEVLGAANASAGTFTVAPAGAAFVEHLIDSGALSAELELLLSVEAVSRLEEQLVDLSELPANLGAFDIPVASWHQKFLTLDQEVAYIGGMNIKTSDWDTHEHAVFEPRRMAFDASTEARVEVLNKAKVSDFKARKDYMVRLEGPAVYDAVTLFRERWVGQIEAEVENAALATGYALSPPSLPFETGVQAQVVTTMPAPFHETSIADTLLRAISKATDYIFIEDQYFRAPILADAIVDRMLEVDTLVLIVVTSPIDEWVDPGCWQTNLQHELFKGLFADRYGRFQVRSFGWRERDCTLCTDDIEGIFQEMSLHSKLVIIDDLYLQTGSCNHNNRGLLYEGEAAVAVVDGPWVSNSRALIFENMLGSYYEEGSSGEAWLIRFKAAALWNDAVYADWSLEGYDLDLDLEGDVLPEFWSPIGFIYTLDPGPPSDCLIEEVGEDITSRLP